MKWKKLGADAFGDYECEGFKIYKGIKGKRWFLINKNNCNVGEFDSLKNAKVYAEKIMNNEVI